MTSKKVYTTPKLNSYGEFAQLTQQSGFGFADFIGSVTVSPSNGTVTVSGTVTVGANPRTSDINFSLVS